jgi:hypothetical protein
MTTAIMGAYGVCLKQNFSSPLLSTTLCYYSHLALLRKWGVFNVKYNFTLE